MRIIRTRWLMVNSNMNCLSDLNLEFLYRAAFYYKFTILSKTKSLNFDIKRLMVWIHDPDWAYQLILLLIISELDNWWAGIWIIVIGMLDIILDIILDINLDIQNLDIGFWILDIQS